MPPPRCSHKRLAEHVRRLANAASTSPYSMRTRRTLSRVRCARGASGRPRAAVGRRPAAGRNRPRPAQPRPRRVAAVGDHHRDRLADVADLIARERGLGAHDCAGLPIRFGMRSVRIGAGRSSAVNTACTPGRASAAAVSMPDARHAHAGCARSRRTACRAAHVVDEAARPVSSAGPRAGARARRNAARPCHRHGRFAVAQRSARRVECGGDDARVAGERQKIAGERLAHLRLARVGGVAQKLVSVISMPGVQKPHCSP